MANTRKAVRGLLLDAVEHSHSDVNDEVFEALMGVASFSRLDSVLVDKEGFFRMAEAAWKESGALIRAAPLP